MKKSGFFTFIFALIPGAGHMYLGLLKKGVFIMSLFCALGMMTTWLHHELFVFFVPVVWFYSFFDALNLRHYTHEQLAAMNREFTVGSAEWLRWDASGLARKRHVLLGALCILLGTFILFETLLYSYILRFMPWLYDLIRHVPTLLLAAVIIFIGIRLVKGGPAPQASGSSYEEYAYTAPAGFDEEAVVPDAAAEPVPEENESILQQPEGGPEHEQ